MADAAVRARLSQQRKTTWRLKEVSAGFPGWISLCRGLRVIGRISEAPQRVGSEGRLFAA